MKKKKEHWEMTTAELREATKKFDNPNYHPPAVKPTSAERAQLRRWQSRRQAARSRLMLVLDNSIIRDADLYAADRGLSVSEVVTTALNRLIRKKSA